MTTESRFAPLRTTEMHTGGEPVRIVESGYPDIMGDTILAKRRYASEHLDHLRRLLMFEPRGHHDMYGVVPVAPDHPEADLAVLFMHNEGYSTMCGHATIAVGRWAVDHGLVAVTEPVTEFGLQVPAGVVKVRVTVDGGEPGRVSFVSVPAFAEALDVTVDVGGYGPVTVDVGFGGAFYALVPAADLGVSVTGSPVAEQVEASWAVTRAVAASHPIHHPDEDDLAFLYGTILTDGGDGVESPSANLCVFADREVDRSPTGSGVTARLAVAHARGLVRVGEQRSFASITGAVFTGEIVAETTAGVRSAVLVEVGGRSHYSGEAVFTVEDDDPLPGFLLR